MQQQAARSKWATEQLAADAIAVVYGDVDPDQATETSVMLQIAFGTNVTPLDADAVTTTWTVTYDGVDYTIAVEWCVPDSG